MYVRMFIIKEVQVNSRLPISLPPLHPCPVCRQQGITPDTELYQHSSLTERLFSQRLETLLVQVINSVPISLGETVVTSVLASITCFVSTYFEGPLQVQPYNGIGGILPINMRDNS